jgi:hypothetical protein
MISRIDWQNRNGLAPVEKGDKKEHERSTLTDIRFGARFLVFQSKTYRMARCADRP